ncbi:hypothetical protein ACU4GI_09890 [Cupriavidus basilensis]
MTEVNIGSICLQAKIRTFTYGHVGNPEPCGGCRILLGAKTNAAKKTPTPTAHRSPSPLKQT